MGRSLFEKLQGQVYNCAKMVFVLYGGRKMYYRNEDEVVTTPGASAEGFRKVFAAESGNGGPDKPASAAAVLRIKGGKK